MKRLVCRNCGSSFFKFRQADSSIQCYKCESMIKIDGLNEKNNNNVNNISILWRHVVG